MLGKGLEKKGNVCPGRDALSWISRVGGGKMGALNLPEDELHPNEVSENM